MVQVIKANHQKEQFSEEKVAASIKRAGIPAHLQEKVLAEIKAKLYENIPTFEIYQTIIDALSRSEHPYSRAKYSLKQSIMMLGPTGYPFEDFISRVLEEHGYITQTRQLVTGKCVTHEIDVIAQKEQEKAMIEAKFHNNPGTRSDVRVALYVKARFDDIKDTQKFTKAWLVTNTKTTLDANAYAACSGMKVMSWNYPEGDSLRELIEKSRLQPITILTTLSAAQKIKLLERRIILCRDLNANRDILKTLGLNHDQEVETINELRYICESHHMQE